MRFLLGGQEVDIQVIDEVHDEIVAPAVRKEDCLLYRREENFCE